MEINSIYIFNLYLPRYLDIEFISHVIDDGVGL
jgi:hypothetical protein